MFFKKKEKKTEPQKPTLKRMYCIVPEKKRFDTVEQLFESKTFELNDEYGYSAKRQNDENMMQDGEIVYKWKLPTLQAVMKEEDGRIYVYSIADGQPFERFGYVFPISKEEAAELIHHSVALEVEGGTGKMLLCDDDDRYYFDEEAYHPWECYLRVKDI